MSRSFKKYPIVRDNNRGMKKILRRKFRRSLLENDNLPQYGNYRKMTEKWEFCDFAFWCEFEDFYDRNAEYIDKKTAYHNWYTCYKMK